MVEGKFSDFLIFNICVFTKGTCHENTTGLFDNLSFFNNWILTFFSYDILSYVCIIVHLWIALLRWHWKLLKPLLQSSHPVCQVLPDVIIKASHAHYRLLCHCCLFGCWPSCISPVHCLIKYVLGVASTPRQGLGSMFSTTSHSLAPNSLATSTPDQGRKVSAEVVEEDNNLNNTAGSNAFSADGSFMDLWTICQTLLQCFFPTIYLSVL